jgi:hypothetical protein
VREQLDPTDFQITVAHLFFTLKASHGYAVAGGAGLLASELISRPTHDLDLFTHPPVWSVKPARDTFIKATGRRGWQVTVLVDTATFCRMHIVDRDDEVLVDLAIDSPPSVPPTMTILGPTLAPLELAGRKLLALFGRAEARDFADVYVLAERFGREQLLAQAELLDAGFDRPVLAQMIGTLGRFADDEVPLPPELVGAARRFFASWIKDL